MFPKCPRDLAAPCGDSNLPRSPFSAHAPRLRRLRYGQDAVDAPRTFTDDAERTVSVPQEPRRLFAAGAPAEVLLYTLAPERLVGRNHAPSEAALAYMPPELRNPVLIRELPNRDNAEADGELLALMPDLYVDYGTVDADYVGSLEAVQARTGVPAVILDGALEQIPNVYRRLGDLLGASSRGEELARETERVLGKYRGILATNGTAPRVYLACAQNGLVPCLAGHSFGEAAEWLGAVNVAGSLETAPRRPATLAEIEAWDPEAVIAPSAEGRDRLLADPAWQELRAVREHRVHAAPTLPFNWGPRPPSVNRMLGLVWLAYVIPNRELDDGFYADIQSLFATYYHVEVAKADIDRLLAP